MVKFYKDYQPASCRQEIRTHQKICNRRFRKTRKLTKLSKKELFDYQLDKAST